MRLPQSLFTLTASVALSFVTQGQSKAAPTMLAVEPVTRPHVNLQPVAKPGRLSQALAAAQAEAGTSTAVIEDRQPAARTLDVLPRERTETLPVAHLSEPVGQTPETVAVERDMALTSPLGPVAAVADAPTERPATEVKPVAGLAPAPVAADTTPSPPAVAPTLTFAETPVSQSSAEPPASYQEMSPGVYVPAAYVVPAPSTLQPALDSASRAVLALGTVSSESPRYPLLQVAPLTSSFGYRWGRLHAGVDLGAAVGTPVVAALSGHVVSADWNGGYGNCVVLRHRDGTIETLYGHLSRFTVQPGQLVQQGQVIGWSGVSGYATGPHLHFELRQLTTAGWQAVDINDIVSAAAQVLTQGVGATDPVVASTSAAVDIRVALATQVKQISVGASTPAVLTNADGSAIATLNPLQPLELLHTTNGLYAGAQRLPSLLRLTPQPGGAVAVNGVWYRGTILIADLPGGLSVINWVSLEDYLVSVVGSEAYPSWGAAALQAQAIAARSYALWYRHNPANAWYDLAAGPEYQAYAGLAKEFTSTAQAVAATQGLVLTSATGNVLQAQYAATQAISDAYHGGQGLSQWGAAALAAAGYDYLTILGQFYPGAQLSRLGG